YVGHLEAFDWNLLGNRAFGLKSMDSTLDRLFAFGIDPVDGGLPSDQPNEWPSREEVVRYSTSVRGRLDSAITTAFTNPSEGHPQLAKMLETAIERRLMHAETLAYMFHRLPFSAKKKGSVRMETHGPRRKQRFVDIPAGPATLGFQPQKDDAFCWDNELSA